MGSRISLENRSVLEVKGPEARDFLQGILTSDVLQLNEGDALYAGLLTPQGKLLFEFFVVLHGETYLLDVDKGEAGNLVKRLMFYKLRADVDIARLETATVCAEIEGKPEPVEGAIVFRDPRTKKAGHRLIVLSPKENFCVPDEDIWLAHRISIGLPEAGADFAYGNCFPHDIAMDQLNGIGFKKGCYVGQEVVSRMQHRGSARKRPMIVLADENLPAAPVKIEAEGGLIGTTGSVRGNQGVAEIRLDRALKALKAGKRFEADGIEVKLQTPDWADYGDDYDVFGKQEPSR